MRVEGPGKAVEVPHHKINVSKPTVVEETNTEEKPGKIGMDKLIGHKAGAAEFQEAVDIANKALKLSNHRLEFQLHEASGRYQVKVVDSLSEEVIKEIPPDYLLDFSAKIQEMVNDVVGLLVDEII